MTARDNFDIEKCAKDTLEEVRDCIECTARHNQCDEAHLHLVELIKRAQDAAYEKAAEEVTTFPHIAVLGPLATMMIKKKILSLKTPEVGK